MGIRFNGTSQYLSVANESFFDWERTQAFSGALWVYDVLSSGGPILSKASSETGTGVGWALNLGANFNLHLTADNAGNNEIFKYAPDRFGMGGILPFTWQHIGFTYDGSSTLAGCSLFYNGIEVTGDGTPANEDNLSASILVNQAVRSGFINPSEFVPGGVANIVLFDQELSAADMAEVANPANIYNNPNEYLGIAPKLWLPLTSTSDLTDQSGNGNNATLTASPTSIADPEVMLDQVSGGTGTTTFSWTHTPFATPRGVVVMVAANTSGTDVISGVTYGGVAMTRVGFAADTGGEIGAAWMYFLGSGVLSGARTVQVTVSSGSTAKRGVAATLLAGGDIRVAASGVTQGDAANPNVTLTTTSEFRGMAIGWLFSGKDATSNLTAGTDFQLFGQHDFGVQVALGQWGAKEGANIACGLTATSDDVAMVAAAFEALSVLLAAGSFAVTGNAATLAREVPFNAQPASYTYTGNAAELVTGRALVALPGTYTVTGADADVNSDVSVNAATGTLTVSGTAATLLAGYSVSALSDGYLITGATADLVAVGAGAFLINADPGDLDVTGTDMVMAGPSNINATNGVVTITGANATLTAGIPGAVTYLAGEQGFIADYGRGRIRELAGRLS
jgi:hypothetical protein